MLTHTRNNILKPRHAYRIIINLVRIKSTLKGLHTKICALLVLGGFFFLSNETCHKSRRSYTVYSLLVKVYDSYRTI